MLVIMFMFHFFIFFSYNDIYDILCSRLLATISQGNTASKWTVDAITGRSIGMVFFFCPFPLGGDKRES